MPSFDHRYTHHLRLLIAVGFLLQPGLAGSTVPQPIVATTSTDFFGYDGAWSAVNIRIGSPAQWVSVFPSTLSQETWVIGPNGCDGTTTCESKRGGLFYANESYSFEPEGFYDLNFDSQLGDSGYGYYGTDVISLNDQASLANQIVAVVNSTDQWLGSLGLGVQETRFNGAENFLPLLSSLVENVSLIPSHSYGYTAGAFYRLKSVPASLTFGGVDANRFVPNDMTFSLGTGYAPVVAITSISVSSSSSTAETLPANWNSNPETLLDDTEAALFTIDSSTPFLWLPETVCDSFATALNLTYDDELQVYVFSDDNSSSPDALASWNLTFTFTLSNLPESHDGVELTLPYDAFNLQLSYPFPNLDANFTSPSVNYFPLRRAANATQYTIGRVFLQETYLTVDYERNNFSLSQAVFTMDAVSHVNLMSISRPGNSSWAGPNVSTKSRLSSAAKAGIGVGSAVGAVAIAVIIWIFWRRKKSARVGTNGEKTKRRHIFSRLRRTPDSNSSVSELLGDKRHPTEAPADSSVTRFELSGSTPVEMPAAPVSPGFLATSQAGGQRRLTTLRNDHSHPAELEQRNSVCKGGDIAASDRSASPVPPYSPPEISNRHFGSSVSPSSLRHSPEFGTLSSGEQGISPVGANSGGHSQISSNSNNNSMPSPVSPEAAPGPQTHFPGQSHAGPAPNDTLVVPQLHGRPPSRSPSNGSRFQEEGLGPLGEEQGPDTPGQPHLQSRRFSWEQ